MSVLSHLDDQSEQLKTHVTARSGDQPSRSMTFSLIVEGLQMVISHRKSFDELSVLGLRRMISPSKSKDRVSLTWKPLRPSVLELGSKTGYLTIIEHIYKNNFNFFI